MLFTILFALSLLALLSAFFSASETAFVAVNQHELTSPEKKKTLGSALALSLLKQPEKTLTLILLGNNFANVCFAALVTFLTLFYGNENLLFVSSILTTFFILIFCEVFPKTIALYYPEKLSRSNALLLYPFMKLLNPFVLFISGWTIFFRRVFFPAKLNEAAQLTSSRATIRSAVLDARGILSQSQTDMLLGAIEVGSMQVEEIMKPLHLSKNLNIAEDLTSIKPFLKKESGRVVLVYRRNFANCLGFLTRHQIKLLLGNNSLTKRNILKAITKPVYIPANVDLPEQIKIFVDKNIEQALVVDEYGELQGVLSLYDIITKIAGQSTSLVKDTQSDSFIVTGDTPLREINQKLGVSLDLTRATTLQGLVYEELEALPAGGVCILKKDIGIEISKVEKGRIMQARIWRQR